MSARLKDMVKEYKAATCIADKNAVTEKFVLYQVTVYRTTYTEAVKKAKTALPLLAAMM